MKSGIAICAGAGLSPIERFPLNNMGSCPVCHQLQKVTRLGKVVVHGSRVITSLHNDESSSDCRSCEVEYIAV